MTPEQIKQLAKQAGGTQPYTDLALITFDPAALAEFARLVRESDIGQDEERHKVIAHLRHAYKQYGNDLDKKAADMLSTEFMSKDAK